MKHCFFIILLAFLVTIAVADSFEKQSRGRNAYFMNEVQELRAKRFWRLGGMYKTRDGTLGILRQKII